jgi:hypothetical protein
VRSKKQTDSPTDDLTGFLGLVAGILCLVFHLTLKWPWQVARWLFCVHAPMPSKIALVYQIRLALGVIIVASVALRYDSLDDRILDAAVYKFAVGLALSLPLFLAAMIFVIIKASQDRANVVRRLAAGPGLTIVGGMVAIPAGFWLAGHGHSWLRDLSGYAGDQSGLLWGVVGVAANVLEAAALPSGLAFAICCMYYLWRDLFRAGDGHRLLPALVAPLMAVIGSIVDLRNPVSSDVPKTVSYIVGMGGTVVVIGLAIWEFWCLRNEFGVGWDDAPAEPDAGLR